MRGSALVRAGRGTVVRPSVRALAVGGVGIGVLAPISLRGAWEGHSLVAFTALLVAVSYVVCGAWLVESPLSAASGWWTVGVGVLWVLNNAGVGQAGAWPFINWCVSAVVWVPVALIISSYPRGVRWSREHRRWLLVAVVYLGPGCAALTLFARPEWSGFSTDAWWPTTGTSRALFEATSAVAGVAYVLLSLWFVRIIRRRLQGLSAIDRAVLRPALWGSAGAALLASTASLVQNLVLTSDAWATSVAVQGLGLLALPAVVAYSAHRAITTRERVADLVLQLGAPSHDAVRSLLRSCLGDDSLDVLYRAHDPERFVDHDGAPVAGPPADRLVVPVRGGQGDVIAVVSADPRLRQHEALVDATVLAAGFVLANVRLQADLRSRVTEAEAARSLVVDSQRTERERVADDLHDGLQQALLGLRARARAVQTLTERGDVAEEADHVADHAQEVLQRVRLVSRGLSSPLLRSEGLDVALEEVTDQLAAAGLVVDLDVEGAPVGERVKDVAYMWISEALACVSDAGASQASVSVLCRAEQVRIDVRDDAARDAAWPEEAVRALTRRAQMADGEVSLDGAPEGVRAPRVSVVLPDPQPAGA